MCRQTLIGCAVLMSLLLAVSSAHAIPRAPVRLMLAGLYMEPNGPDAQDYGTGHFGVSASLIAPVSQKIHWLAGVAGADFVSLLDKTKDLRDSETGLRVEQVTSQTYFRFFLGGQIGGHARGFLRPHAGFNVALIVYGYSTDVVVPDDYNTEQEIRQNLESEHHVTVGQDINLGLDFRLSRRMDLDLGVRYLKSLGVEQNMGRDLVTVYPEYAQVYLGIGFSFGTTE